MSVKNIVKMIITSNINARKLLIHLKKNSRESITDDDLLTKKYQRFWNIICSRQHDDFNQRARLFHFVLAANNSSTIQMLFTVLRIRDDNFDRFSQRKNIMRLFFNFLIWNEKTIILNDETIILNDETKTFEFVHNSTKNFIRNLNMKQNKIAKRNEKKFFSNHRNHENVVKLYMNLIKSTTYSYWIEMNIEINKWNNYVDDSSEERSIERSFENFENRKHASHDILTSYFKRHELTHFLKAARKRNFDDSVWENFIQRLIFFFDSTFDAFLLNNIDYWYRHFFF